MKKILIFVLFFLGLVSIYLSNISGAKAAGVVCKLKDLGELAPDYNGPVTLEPEAGQPADCFTSNQNYIVVFYPQNYNLNNALSDSQTNGSYITFQTIPNFTIKAGGGSGTLPSLTGNIDLNKATDRGFNYSIDTLHGEGHAGRWEVVVCVGPNEFACDTLKNKNASSNIVARGLFTVKSGTVSRPGATPPPGLPSIDIVSQDRCLYRTGDDVVIKKVITNYPDPDVEYQWWWDGKRNYTPIPGSKNVTQFSVNIPGNCTGVSPKESCTQNLGNGTYRLCIDFSRYILSAVSQFPQNCINLTFQKQPIAKETNISCNPDTRGSTEECTPDIVKTCTLQGKICNLGKCAPSVSSSAKTCKDSGTIQTAIGCIHTDPALLLTDLFTFTPPIMGLIAFLMMVYSGIKMILSGGNPQAIGGARDMFINAVIGLLFALFSVLLLQILGADIFHLPGFTR